MGLGAATGAIKSTQHFKITAQANTAAFAGTQAITAVVVAKTVLLLNGVMNEGTAGMCMIHLASTTSVEFSFASVAVADDFSFTVIEYH